MSSVGFGAAASLRKATFQASVVAATLTILLAAVMEVPWNIEDCSRAALIALVPLIGGLMVERWTRFAILGEIMVSLGVVLTMMFVGAALALLSTRTPAPMADRWLITVDRAMFFSAPKIVSMVNEGPPWFINLLQMAYARTGLFLFITLIASHIMGRRHIAWRMILTWVLSLVIVLLIAFVVPAFGCFRYVDSHQASALPAEAGRYYWHALEAFRSDPQPILALNRVGAVVSFPSFHTICALIFAQAWRGVRIASPVAASVAAIIIVATIPMGGHYVADVLAGVAVWMLCTYAVARSLQTRDRPVEVLMPLRA